MQPTNRSKYLPHAALMAVSLIYGANFSLAKEVMPLYILPYGFILLRVVFAVVLFWITGLLVKETVARKDSPRLIACGIFGVAINQLFFFKGLNITSPINASLLMPGNSIAASIANEFAEATTPMYQSALLALGFLLFAVTFIVLAIAKLMLMQLKKREGN